MALTLIVGSNKNFDTLSGSLKRCFEVITVSSYGVAMNIASELAIDLLVVDENLSGIDGLKIIKEVTNINPFINTALVSSLSPEEFHDVSEGLGIIMQLSTSPTLEEANILVEKFNEILTLTATNGSHI
ncbi:MAG: hypothetical protein GY714_22100 [Desulfobacterales bacterium]|nr:hypothetical protein [Desulfobacterales bacterium]MCP4160401.1 hypothetical protein [Deltaproteobacteria bacterium]